MDSQFAYEMELPPNCVIRVSKNPKELRFTTVPNVAARRKDQPLLVPAEAGAANQISITVQHFPSHAEVLFAAAVFCVTKLPCPLTSDCLLA